jgi:hypothetical protein
MAFGKTFRMWTELTLTPTAGVLLLLVMIFAGRAFRQNWKAQRPGWERRAWLLGLPATLAFFALAFIPLRMS